MAGHDKHARNGKKSQRYGNLKFKANRNSNSSAGPLLDTYGREFQLPDFTMKEIYEAIPARCFERSLLRSLGYVARDISAILIIGYAAISLIPLLPSTLLRVVAWGVYAFVQGLFGTGLWVLAHEVCTLTLYLMHLL